MADSAGHGDLRMSGRGEPPDESEVLIPAAVREAFPGLEVPTDGDVDVIAAQLGRRPRGRILVTCRCPHGRPAVILPFRSRGAAGRCLPCSGCRARTPPRRSGRWRALPARELQPSASKKTRRPRSISPWTSRGSRKFRGRWRGLPPGTRWYPGWRAGAWQAGARAR
jgi:hypothetical protein